MRPEVATNSSNLNVTLMQFELIEIIITFSRSVVVMWPEKLGWPLVLVLLLCP